MILDTSSMKPIYVQIAEWLETEIMSGSIAAGERIYSQYQLAEMFNINPATAARGLGMLAEDDIVYKKRGLGMFVSPDAMAIIKNKRKRLILDRLIIDLVAEAGRLDIDDDELVGMIQRALNRNRE